MTDLLNRLSGGELLALAGILGGVAVLVALVVMGFLSSMRAAGLRAALQRDMLARGLAVEEIERLTESDQERRARHESQQKLRLAQIDADLKRDLLARGLSAEQVRQLTQGREQVTAEANALADVIVNMVKESGLDRDAVAGLLALVLKRDGRGIDLTADLGRLETKVTADGGLGV